MGLVSDGSLRVFDYASGRMRAFFHSDGTVALIIDEFMREVKFVRAVGMASSSMLPEIPSRPEAFEAERVMAWRTSDLVTGRNRIGVLEGGRNDCSGIESQSSSVMGGCRFTIAAKWRFQVSVSK